MSHLNVTVYGSKSCQDTTRATAFLYARGIPFEFKDVDQSPELNQSLADMNNGKRVMPTIRINDETLINPPLDELRHAIDSAAVPV